MHACVQGRRRSDGEELGGSSVLMVLAAVGGGGSGLRQIAAEVLIEPTMRDMTRYA